MADSSKCSRLQKSIRTLQRTVGLPFSNLLPADQVAQVLAEVGVIFRDRVFNPVVSLWTFLSQVLSPDQACRAAVARLLAWRAAKGLKPCSADTASYCQARKRLSTAALQTLTRRAGQQMQAEVNPSWLWKGRSVKIVDGTTTTMPDTPANQRAFPRRKHQKHGVGFPILRLVVLFSLACGAALDLAFGPTKGKRTGETTLFRTRLLAGLEPGDVLLGDRLFDSYRDVASLRQRRVDVVLRMHATRRCDFRRGRRLGPNDHLVTWRRPAFDRQRLDRATYEALPEEMLMRELRFRVCKKGFRTDQVVVVTTLLQAALYSAAEIADLYRQRWHAELDLNALKTTLNMEHLRCKTPAMVEKEIWAHFLAYNLLRQTMAAAASTVGVMPRQLSFKGALQTITAFTIYQAHQPHDGLRLWQELLRAIACHVVGDRPDRYEPRKLKHRPGKYSYMTKPRDTERQKLCA
jgi:Transposase DDE domain